jgi:putative transposase
MGSTFYSLHYHVVYGTKDRRPLIRSGWGPRLHEYLGGTVRGLGGIAEAVGGSEDHIHALLSLKTTDAPAELIRELKKASALHRQSGGTPSKDFICGRIEALAGEERREI